MSFILENHPDMELVSIDKERFKGLSDGFGYKETGACSHTGSREKDISWHCSIKRVSMKIVPSRKPAQKLTESFLTEQMIKRQKGKRGQKQEDLMKFLKNCKKGLGLRPHLYP